MKVYLIDEANNMKVVGRFETKKEGEKYISNLYSTGREEEEPGVERKERWYFIKEEEMKEAVRKYGRGMKNYYTP